MENNGKPTWGSNIPGHVCTRTSGNKGPVHQHADQSWWFVDEADLDEFGPFATEVDAEWDLARYAREL